MAPLDLNIEYNARRTILDHEEISARWDDRAASYRGEAACELDIPYAGTERSVYDFFPVPGAAPSAPLCVFIHGGYWRARSAKTFSHIARGLNARGISVAMPTYDLTPSVSVPQIIEQMRVFLVKLWENTGRRPVVAGHSAGGHLASAMLATDWSKVEGAPGGLVQSAFALSGLYDLEPILKIDVNDDVRLTPASAREASTLHWPAPRAGLKLVAAVGALESEAFKDQSRSVAEVWGGRGVTCEYLEVPGCHHLSVVDAVSAPGHMLFERLVATIESAAARSGKRKF